MDELTPFEQRLAERLRTYADGAVKPVDAAAIARAARGDTRPPRAWGIGAWPAARHLGLFAAVAVSAVIVLGALALTTRPGLPGGELPGVISPTSSPTSSPTPSSGPSPSVLAYTVTVPDGVTTLSQPVDVERAALAWMNPKPHRPPARVASIEWLPPETDYPGPDGPTSFGEGAWVVDVRGGDEASTIVFLSDQTLAALAWTGYPPNDPDATSEPEATPDGVGATTSDLVARDGRVVSPRAEEPVPLADERPWGVGAGRLTAGAGVVWGTIDLTQYGEPPQLLRVDTRTGETSAVALPVEADGGGAIDLASDGLWFAGGGRLLLLDPSDASVVRSFPLRSDVFSIAREADGVWVARVRGTTLIDATTGRVLREIETQEGEGNAYRTILEGPAFGSLWDLDRSTGTVHRIDPQTGETVSTIELEPQGRELGCGPDDPTPVVGLDGVADAMSLRCGAVQFVIDPATETVVRTFPVTTSRTFIIDGEWWGLVLPDEFGVAASLVRLDPTTGTVLREFTFAGEETAALDAVVAGDSLWLVVGQRPAANRGWDLHQRVVRISLDDLRGQ